MAHDEHLTPFFKMRMVFLAAFRPTKFFAISNNFTIKKDNPGLSAEEYTKLRISRIRSGWLRSFAMVLWITIFGLCVGIILNRSYPHSNLAWITAAAGGLIILWATVSLRGWEIQSMAGNTLPELVNKWAFTGACALGTAFLTISAGWSIDWSP